MVRGAVPGQERKGIKMENENQTPHKRRVHYKGKYPKKFEEKYKELQPENTKTPSRMSSRKATPRQACISPLW